MTLVHRRASSLPLGGKRVRAPSLSRGRVRCAPNLARSRQRRSPSGCPPPNEGGNHTRIRRQSHTPIDANRRDHLPLGRVGLKQTNHQPTAFWPYVPDGWVIRGHQRSSEAVPPPSGRMYLMKETSTRHQASPGATRRHQASSGVIRGHQRTCTRMDPRPPANRDQRPPSAP